MGDSTTTGSGQRRRFRDRATRLWVEALTTGCTLSGTLLAGVTHGPWRVGMGILAVVFGVLTAIVRHCRGYTTRDYRVMRRDYQRIIDSLNGQLKGQLELVEQQLLGQLHIIKAMGRLVDDHDPQRRAGTRGSATALVLEAARNLCGSDSNRTRAVLYSSDGDGLKYFDHVGRGQPRKTFDRSTRHGEHVCRIAHESTDAELRKDIWNDPPPGLSPREAQRKTYRSLIAAPVWAGDRRHGLLAVDSPEPDKFNDNDAALLTLLGVTLALAYSCDRCHGLSFSQRAASSSAVLSP